MQFAAIAATLTAVVALVQAAFMVRFLWQSREMLAVAQGLGEAIYFPLAVRILFVLVGLVALFVILFHTQKQGARASLLLNALLLIALVWSLVPLFASGWGQFFASLNPVGKVIFPITRLAVLCWLLFGTFYIWKIAIPDQSGVKNDT